MASLDAPQIQVLANSVRDRNELDTDNETQQTPLLGQVHQRSAVGSRFRSCCVKSKAAVAIIFANILTKAVIQYVLQFVSANTLFVSNELTYLGTQPQEYVPLFYGSLALLYLFYPLAGCLADIKLGRYNIIVRSLWFSTVTGFLTIICCVIIVYYWYTSDHSTKTLIAGTVIVMIFGGIIAFSGYIPFSANVIQFGMDQLYDSPSEDSVHFIHWFVFSSHFGQVINTIGFQPIVAVAVEDYRRQKTTTAVLIAITHAIPAVLLLAIGIPSWFIHKYKRHWFMIDQASRNPYKLVYKVIKFAAQHKTPICRSAFTYCEDELPSRMDLGKNKYGGPFTTEQVEDVKAFLGIMALLLTLGPMLATDIAGDNVLLQLYYHFFITEQVPTMSYNVSQIHVYYLTTGGLSEIIIVISIPLYICLFRSFIHRYVPGILKRIGLGILIRILSLFSITLIDSIGHFKSFNYKNCFVFSKPSLSISLWYLTIPNVLNALSAMLFYIAIFEFVCAQSPHAMKGLIIGTFFAIKGTSQFLGATVLYVPFFSWSLKTSFPSCGFVYYLVNIFIALSGLVAYTYVARRYQYRQRDEPDNIYRSAEDYYDRAIDERLHSSYDYSNDTDNLNVHTVDK